MVLATLYRKPFKATYSEKLKTLLRRIERIYPSLNHKSRRIVEQLSADPSFPSKILREKASRSDNKHT